MNNMLKTFTVKLITVLTTSLFVTPNVFAESISVKNIGTMACLVIPMPSETGRKVSIAVRGLHLPAESKGSLFIDLKYFDGIFVKCGKRTTWTNKRSVNYTIDCALNQLIITPT